MYVNSKTDAEKNLLIALSPGAWVHINMVGHYRFCGLGSDRVIDQAIAKWNWQQALKIG